MVDLGRCHAILTAALRPVAHQEHEPSLPELATALSLQIVPINYSRDVKFGMVVGTSQSQCLIHHRKGGAFLLDLTEIPEGEPLPRRGDEIKVIACEGVLTTSIRVSSRNLRANKAAEKGLPEYLKNTFSRD